jgi:hypothetical protein
MSGLRLPPDVPTQTGGWAALPGSSVRPMDQVIKVKQPLTRRIDHVRVKNIAARLSSAE